FFHCLTYFLNFGSSASCSPSPNTLKANIVNEIKNAGKNNVHQCPDRIAPRESFAITPQLATGAILSGHRSEEHTSELQSRFDLVCRLLLEKKKKNVIR